MGKRIFLVEDEKIIREMYERALKMRGYEVESAIDGEEALQKLENPTPQFDLILLDIMIPKLDGLSVLKKIKTPESKTKEVPVFLLTNLGQENLLKDALSNGAAQYFIKSNMLPMQMVDEINSFLKKQEVK